MKKTIEILEKSIKYAKKQLLDNWEKLSEEETIKLAKNMVEQNTTLRGLESDVSPSTLYNLFTKKTLGEDLYNEVSNQYDENKKRK